MMYDLKSGIAQTQAKMYLNKLIEKGNVIELKKLDKRSLSQNNYLHLIIGWFGLEFGYHMEESKMVYKYLNKDLYIYEKDGFMFVRSSAELTAEDMTQSIEKFRSYSGELGLHLPAPEDQDYLQAIQIELKNKKYL